MTANSLYKYFNRAPQTADFSIYCPLSPVASHHISPSNMQLLAVYCLLFSRLPSILSKLSVVCLLHSYKLLKSGPLYPCWSNAIPQNTIRDATTEAGNNAFSRCHSTLIPFPLQTTKPQITASSFSSIVPAIPFEINLNGPGYSQPSYQGLTQAGTLVP